MPRPLSRRSSFGGGRHPDVVRAASAAALVAPPSSSGTSPGASAPLGSVFADHPSTTRSPPLSVAGSPPLRPSPASMQHRDGGKLPRTSLPGSIGATGNSSPGLAPGLSASSPIPVLGAGYSSAIVAPPAGSSPLRPKPYAGAGQGPRAAGQAAPGASRADVSGSGMSSNTTPLIASTAHTAPNNAIATNTSTTNNSFPAKSSPVGRQPAPAGPVKANQVVPVAPCSPASDQTTHVRAKSSVSPSPRQPKTPTKQAQRRCVCIVVALVALLAVANIVILSIAAQWARADASLLDAEVEAAVSVKAYQRAVFEEALALVVARSCLAEPTSDVCVGLGGAPDPTRLASARNATDALVLRLVDDLYNEDSQVSDVLRDFPAGRQALFDLANGHSLVTSSRDGCDAGTASLLACVENFVVAGDSATALITGLVHSRRNYIPHRGDSSMGRSRALLGILSRLSSLQFEESHVFLALRSAGPTDPAYAASITRFAELPSRQDEWLQYAALLASPEFSGPIAESFEPTAAILQAHSGDINGVDIPTWVEDHTARQDRLISSEQALIEHIRSQSDDANGHVLGYILYVVIVALVSFGVFSGLGYAAQVSFKADKRDQELVQEAMQRAHTLFIRYICHELRNPLHGICASVELLQDMEMSTDVKELVGTISTSTQAMLHLADDVLDYSRLQEGKMELIPVPTDVRAVIRDVVNQFRVMVPEGVQLISAVHRSTPQLVVLDGPRLRQVISNGLTNAIKVTTRGKIMIRVTAIPVFKSKLVDPDVIAAFPGPATPNEDGSRSEPPTFIDGGYVGNAPSSGADPSLVRNQTSGSPSSGANASRPLPRLSSPLRDAGLSDNTVALRVEVVDTGTGLNGRDPESLFMEFTSHLGTKGTGLGLSICRRLVRQMKGDIRLEPAQQPILQFLSGSQPPQFGRADSRFAFPLDNDEAYPMSGLGGTAPNVVSASRRNSRSPSLAGPALDPTTDMLSRRTSAHSVQPTGNLQMRHFFANRAPSTSDFEWSEPASPAESVHGSLTPRASLLTPRGTIRQSSFFGVSGSDRGQSPVPTTPGGSMDKSSLAAISAAGSGKVAPDVTGIRRPGQASMNVEGLHSPNGPVDGVVINPIAVAQPPPSPTPASPGTRGIRPRRFFADVSEPSTVEDGGSSNPRSGASSRPAALAGTSVPTSRRATASRNPTPSPLVPQPDRHAPASNSRVSPGSTTVNTCVDSGVSMGSGSMGGAPLSRAVSGISFGGGSGVGGGGGPGTSSVTGIGTGPLAASKGSLMVGPEQNVTPLEEHSAAVAVRRSSNSPPILAVAHAPPSPVTGSSLFIGRAQEADGSDSTLSSQHLPSGQVGPLSSPFVISTPNPPPSASATQETPGQALSAATPSPATSLKSPEMSKLTSPASAVPPSSAPSTPTNSRARRKQLSLKPLVVNRAGPPPSCPPSPGDARVVPAGFSRPHSAAQPSPRTASFRGERWRQMKAASRRLVVRMASLRTPRGSRRGSLAVENLTGTRFWFEIPVPVVVGSRAGDDRSVASHSPATDLVNWDIRRSDRPGRAKGVSQTPSARPASGSSLPPQHPPSHQIASGAKRPASMRGAPSRFRFGSRSIGGDEEDAALTPDRPDAPSRRPNSSLTKYGGESNGTPSDGDRDGDRTSDNQAWRGSSSGPPSPLIRDTVIQVAPEVAPTLPRSSLSRSGGSRSPVLTGIPNAQPPIPSPLSHPRSSVSQRSLLDEDNRQPSPVSLPNASSTNAKAEGAGVSPDHPKRISEPGPSVGSAGPQGFEKGPQAAGSLTQRNIVLPPDGVHRFRCPSPVEDADSLAVSSLSGSLRETGSGDIDGADNSSVLLLGSSPSRTPRRAMASLAQNGQLHVLNAANDARAAALGPRGAFSVNPSTAPNPIGPEEPAQSALLAASGYAANPETGASSCDLAGSTRTCSGDVGNGPSTETFVPGSDDHPSQEGHKAPEPHPSPAPVDQSADLPPASVHAVGTAEVSAGVPPSGSPATASLSSSASPAATPARVLFVDDEAVNRALGRRMLLKIGVETVVLSDGDEIEAAVFEAESDGRPFSLLFVDVVMKRVNGDIAVAALRAQGCTTPIVCCTGNVAPADEQRMLAAGFNDIIHKPYDTAVLRSAVEKWVTFAGRSPPARPGAGPAARGPHADSSDAASLSGQGPPTERHPDVSPSADGPLR